MRKTSWQLRTKYRIFESWAVLGHEVGLFLQWLIGSWWAGWALLLNRRAITLVFISAIIFTFSFVSPILNQAIFEIISWNTLLVNHQHLEIFIGAPEFVSQSDSNYLDVNIQNGTNTPILDVSVAIRSQEGVLLFQEGNVVTADFLRPGQTVVKKLIFEVAKLNSSECVTTLVVSSYYTSLEPSNTIVATAEGPNMCASYWRMRVVDFSKLPEIMQAIAIFVGYFSSR